MKRIEIKDFLPLPDGDMQFPLEFIEHNRALKLKETESECVIAVIDEQPLFFRRLEQWFPGKKLVFFQIDNEDFRSYLSRKFSIDDLNREDTKREEKIDLDQLANDAPIINLVNSIIIDGIRRNASDIHIETFSSGPKVRYRLNGLLKNVMDLNDEQFLAVSSRIKIMANLNILERRKPQDGRLSVTMGDNFLDVRVSIVPVAGGESIVLRLLNNRRALRTLNDLGIFPEDEENLKKIYRNPHGLVLVTGPTGSGKTTTLNAFLNDIKDESLKLIAIEDPIEMVLDGVDQIQTNDEIGLDFSSLLRRILRQDPDIIMVGEIRDRETAELSVRAALTGHLVLSTLHTNDAAGAIDRLINMGVPDYLLGSVLRGVIAQRLVRTLCHKCKYIREPFASEIEFAKRYDVDLDKVRYPAGCPDCMDTGYSGRTLVLEYFAGNRDLERLIAANDKSGLDAFLSKNRKSFISDGIRKLEAGLTSISEVERIIL